MARRGGGIKRCDNVQETVVAYSAVLGMDWPGQQVEIV